MLIRMNIASAGNGLPRISVEQLATMAKQSEPVDIFTVAAGADRPVGRAMRYELVGDDLWAYCELDERATGARAAAMIIELPDGTLTIKAVWLSELPRAWIEAVGANLSFEEAQHYTFSRAAWKRRPPS